MDKIYNQIVKVSKWGFIKSIILEGDGYSHRNNSASIYRDSGLIFQSSNGKYVDLENIKPTIKRVYEHMVSPEPPDDLLLKIEYTSTKVKQEQEKRKKETGIFKTSKIAKESPEKINTINIFSKKSSFGKRKLIKFNLNSEIKYLRSL